MPNVKSAQQVERNCESGTPPDADGSGGNGVVTINGEPVARVTKWEHSGTSSEQTQTIAGIVERYGSGVRQLFSASEKATAGVRGIVSEAARLLGQNGNAVPAPCPEEGRVIGFDPAGCAPDYSAACDITITEG